DTTTREYRWQGDNLTLININVYSKPPVNIRARFDDRGDLSFMQRESDGQKQQLSNDQIDLYRYRAAQIREISDALRQGRVVLRQGRWRKDSGDNVHLLAVFSPWRSGDTTTREYRWQGDNLTLININVYSKPPVNIRARF
nr:DUF1481 domain-containing protein [Klebsiella pneumoniae]